MTYKNLITRGARLPLILTFIAASLGGVGCGGGNDNPNQDQGVRDNGVSQDGGNEDTGVDPGCFTGVPETENELLNACPLTGCAPFDNATRLPLLGENGELPDLP